MTDERPTPSAEVTPAAPGLRWFGELLLMLGAMAVASYVTIKWRIGGFYSIAAIGMLFLFYTMWRAVRGLPHDGPHARNQISLRTILCWVVPYVAVVAAIISWKGPYETDFLNDNAKTGCLIVLTGAWTNFYMVSRFRAAYRQQPTDEPMAPPLHALDRED